VNSNKNICHYKHAVYNYKQAAKSNKLAQKTQSWHYYHAANNSWQLRKSSCHYYHAVYKYKQTAEKGAYSQHLIFFVTYEWVK
jgi:hypothetical protein